MGLSSPYGVWTGRPTDWDTTEARGNKDRKSPHGYLYFKDDKHKSVKVAVNVKSTDENESRLVFWTGDLSATDAGKKLIAGLTPLLNQEHQFHESPPAPALDLQKDGIVAMADGTIRPWKGPQGDDDIVDALDRFFAPQFQMSTIFLFGEKFDRGVGIHQVHMNQGNAKGSSWFGENGPKQDGGMVMCSPDGKWQYFFIAFGGQAAETDANGNPKGKQLLRDIVKGDGGTGGGPSDDDSDKPDDNGDVGNGSKEVGIQAILANPEGDDNQDGQFEQVRLVNFGDVPASLKDWTIDNTVGGTKPLPDDAVLAPRGGSQDFNAGPECYLPNKGGSVVLKNAAGVEVDRVRYVGADAKSGVWKKFTT